MTEVKPTPVYVVVRYCWRYDDESFDGENRPLAAFRDRAAAERERDRRTAEAKADIAREVGCDYVSDFEDADWKFMVVELLLAARQVPEG